MYYTYQSRRRKRKEERNMMNKNQKRSQIVKNILLKDGLYIEREQTPGITDSENYLPAMRKNLKTILD
jgi:hypothetical protein